MNILLELLLPTFLVHLARALLITTLPLFVLSTLEQSKTHVGVAVGAIGLGKIMSDIPAGLLLERIGPKYLMVVCGTVISGSALLMLLASTSGSYALVVIAMVLCGSGESVGVISRLATVSDEVPMDQRGRVSALLGGSARIAMAIGPLVSGFTFAISGSPNLVFVTQSILAIASVAVVFLVRSSNPNSSPAGTEKTSVAPLGMRRLASVLFNVTIFIISLQLVRECRKLIIPLSAFTAGLSVQEIGIFTSVSFTIDAILFSYAGKIMDGYGRAFAGVLSVSIMTISLLTVVPVTTFSSLLLCAIGTGIGNGISSGIIVAFGADLAPNDSSKSKFLGYFRLCADLGEFVGPLIVGLVAQFTSIPTMINTVVTVGVVGSFWLIKFVPDGGWGKLSSSPPVPSSPRRGIHPVKMDSFSLSEDEDKSPFS
jgi:MFS family permease